MESNEKRLFRSAQAGDANAFGALYAQYANELYRYAYAILRDRHAAEDAVQEACIKVYTNLQNIRKPDAVKAYFFKTLQNTVAARRVHSLRCRNPRKQPCARQYGIDGKRPHRSTKRAVAVDRGGAANCAVVCGGGFYLQRNCRDGGFNRRCGALQAFQVP